MLSSTVFGRNGQKKEASNLKPPGAENGTRTRDPNLGKVVLYQLSYFRNWDCKDNNPFVLSKIIFCRAVYGAFISVVAVVLLLLDN